MDIEWALEQLHEYFRLRERVPLPPSEVTWERKARRRGTAAEISRNDNIVKAIWDATFERPLGAVYAGNVRLLIFELTEGERIRDKLGLDEAPPVFTGNQLHPWVWDSARPHWNSGNHDAAVWAAAVNVNSRLQRKVGRREIGESKLLSERRRSLVTSDYAGAARDRPTSPASAGRAA